MRHRTVRPGKNVSRGLLALALLFASPVLFTLHAESLTILHTNDTHGHLLPFSYPQTPEQGTTEAELSVRTDIGGIARRATLVKRIRQELGGKGTPVWLFDAGDVCDGTPFSTEYHGEADISAMNAAGYDLGVPGNHEFNGTLAQLKKLIGLAKYPILCANATESATGKLLCEPSVLRTVGGIRIAVFGLVTHEAATYPAAKEGVAIAGEVETAREIVPKLRQEADIVILLSHCGEIMDERMAREVPGIDVIVGGHSHSRLPAGELIWRSEELMADQINGTVIVQAFQWGGELGRLDLLFEKDAKGAWHVDRYRERLIPVTSAIPADPEVAEVVDRFWKPIAPRYGQVVGRAAADFSSRGDDLANYNLVADAVRETFGTDIELENMGGVRAPLLQGDITMADLVDVDPFDNTVVTFKLKGSDLKQLLLRAQPAVSGLRYRIENGALTEVMAGGQPLEDGRTYTGATNSYFASRQMKGFELTDTGKKRLEVLVQYIRGKGTVTPMYDGRRIVIGR